MGEARAVRGGGGMNLFPSAQDTDSEISDMNRTCSYGKRSSSDARSN